MVLKQDTRRSWWAFSCFTSQFPLQELWMQNGVAELMMFMAGNNQNFIMFKVAIKCRISQVNDLLDNLGLVPTPYMENPNIIGFAHNEMEKHEMVKLIKQAQRSGDASFVRWSAAAASRLTKELQANLKGPIFAPEGSKRVRKTTERLNIVKEHQKPQFASKAAKRQRLGPVDQHFESEEEGGLNVSQPSDEHVGLLQEAIRKAAAEAAASFIGPQPVIDAAEDQEAAENQPDVVEAVFMPNFSAVYSEAENAEIKRLEAQLEAEKENRITDKIAEIKRLEDLYAMLVVEKDKRIADKDAEIKWLRSFQTNT